MTGERPRAWRHHRGEENHLLPRHGEPLTVYEWLLQHLLKSLACLPVYVVVTILLVLVVRFSL